jgi:hypothetical protein
VTSEERGGPRKGRPDTTTRRHLSRVDGQPLQLGLFIPAHPLHSAEADLRRVVNTIRRDRSHWWIRMIRAHPAECSWCPRCDGTGVAA